MTQLPDGYGPQSSGTLATSSLVYNVCVQAGVRGAGRARPGRVLDAGEQRQDRSHGQEVGPEIHRSVRTLVLVKEC